jgi:hypothetical protein
MKATINEDGVLLIRGESPVETFALRRWLQLYNNSGGVLKIETSYDGGQEVEVPRQDLGPE